MKVADPIMSHTYYIRYLLHPVIEGVKGKEAICKAKVAGFGSLRHITSIPEIQII